ncbi:mandelate racemase/muconate lactonizing enzyme family protein [Parafrankia elaeagni]|uniref:mandelate racemase/muconate lactonizing enzyme family protein n=1 Tax=Parafrankia elaeagni TaxID=222534 RepID=UPI00036FB9A7|nr:mandelate racemase/muconate lactonizing enzyme family protein [Parafrankia elaeagni]
MTAAIASLSTRLVRIPLRRPWAEDVRDVSVVVVEVVDTDGATGHGFSWTPAIGARAVQALLDHDIRAWAVGRPAALADWQGAGPADDLDTPAPTGAPGPPPSPPPPRQPRPRPDDDVGGGWDALWRHLHEAGGGGVTTIAMAGLDLALWDLHGQRTGRSIVDVIGTRRPDAAVYGSGVNLHYPLAELVAQAERWVAAGFDTVKMKVGRPDLRDDLARVRAVREVIGPERTLLVDANQRWSLYQAERAVETLAEAGLGWVEEPLRADDLTGYVGLRRILAGGCAVPVACGENLHTRYRFREFARLGAADVLQPNVVRVGGITPFLRIARDVEAAGLRLAPHLLLEVSGQLALALRQETAVEDVEDAGFGQLGALMSDSPVSVGAARVRFIPAPGLGIAFRPAAEPAGPPG